MTGRLLDSQLWRQRRLWAALAALWTLAVFVACALPGSALRDFSILTPDKLYHAFAFLVFALSWRLAGGRPLAVGVAGVAFAVLIEWWQGNVAVGRYADPYDALADVVGLALGLWTAHVAGRAREERARQNREATRA